MQPCLFEPRCRRTAILQVTPIRPSVAPPAALHCTIHAHSAAQPAQPLSHSLRALQPSSPLLLPLTRKHEIREPHGLYTTRYHTFSAPAIPHPHPAHQRACIQITLLPSCLRPTVTDAPSLLCPRIGQILAALRKLTFGRTSGWQRPDAVPCTPARPSIESRRRRPCQVSSSYVSRL